MADYLYNGVKFPEIPTVSGFDYALLFASKDGTNAFVSLLISNVPLAVRKDKNYKWWRTRAFENCDYKRLGVSESSGKWYIDHSTSAEANSQVHTDENPPLWANYNVPFFEYDDDNGIYYLTDEICLPASEPVPVGSAPEVEPKSFMAGWRMGQFIRGMRV